MSWDKQETKELCDHLVELAEYYGIRQPTEKALALWARSVASDSPDGILNALEDWAKYNAKMPTIAEIRQLAAARLSKRLERDEEAEAAATVPLDKIRPADPCVARAYARWKAARAAVPKRGPKFWEHVSLLYLTTGRLMRNPRKRPGCPGPDFVFLSGAKRDHLIRVYGDKPAEALVEKFKTEVNAQKAAERAVPKFSVFLAEERAKQN